jgi:aspartate-semialdehyde dehydrogenase
MAKAKMIVTKRPQPEQEGLQKIQSAYNDRLTRALTYKAVDEATFEKGGELLKIFSEAAKKAKEEKQKTLGPAELTVTRIKEQWKPFEDGLKQCVAHIKGQMDSWFKAEQKRAEEERERILNDKRIKNEATLQTKLQSVTPVSVGNTRRVLVLVVDDVNLIPREYMVVDEVKLKEALRNGIQVPGARLESEKRIVTAR